MNIYDFSAKDKQQAEQPLSQYRNKVILIVNTATRCGLTPQYEQLEALYKQYKDKGFEILDFPCNQFLEQAPGTDEEISSFCTLNYGTTFPRFSKIDVNGEGTHPLFVFLKEQIDNETEDEQAEAFREKIKDIAPFKGDKDIKWNFTKFLIDKTGIPVARFSPTFKPEALKSAIEKLL